MFGIYQYPSVCAGVIRSKDGGHTWGDVTMLPGHDETALLEVAPGRILAFTRAEGSTTHGVEMSESTDDGRTWSRPMSLLKPKQWPADVCQLRSGRLLLTYGNRTGPFGVGAVLSHDGGRTWDYEHRVLLAWDCQNTDCGYPSTVQLDDGTIVTLLYEVGPSLTYDVARAIVLRYTEAQLRDAMRGQAP